jgi:hypothetical protein
MGKINGEKLWEKLMVLFSIANLFKNFPISSDQGNGNKRMWIFNGTFSHNGNGQKYVN